MLNNVFKDNMEHLQHDYIVHVVMNCLWTIFLYFFLSCNKWSCGAYQIVEKSVMLWFDKDVTEKQHAVKLLTQKGICGTVLTVISAEWRTQKLLSCFNFKFYKYY